MKSMVDQYEVSS